MASSTGRDQRRASSLENGIGNVRLIPLDSGAMKVNNVIVNGPGVLVWLVAVVILGATELHNPARRILPGV